MWIKEVLRLRFIKWLNEANIEEKTDIEFDTVVDGYKMNVKVNKWH